MEALDSPYSGVYSTSECTSVIEEAAGATRPTDLLSSIREDMRTRFAPELVVMFERFNVACSTAHSGGGLLPSEDCLEWARDETQLMPALLKAGYENLHKLVEHP